MALKTLLVCLTNQKSAEAVMACAVPLARAHGAHLVGLHCLQRLTMYPGVAMHIPDGVFTAFDEAQRQDAVALEALFRKHTTAEDFPSEWRLLRAASISVADRVIESARAADLVMLTNARADDDLDEEEQARVIRDCGRPVIVVPPDFRGEAPGRNIALGWSDTREATRAAHDVLLVAQQTATLGILRVGTDTPDALADSGTIEMAAMFDRHGIKVTTAHVNPGGQDVAKILLKYAFEQGADLVATGAFGHSRAYDFVIGAVTHGLLREADIPVLFST